MSKAPRASLCITILDDEDYRVLVGRKGGMEAFGVFVAMILVGRERLQQGQARQVDGTDALAFDNSTAHVLSMTHVTRKQLDACLKLLASVALETHSAPWMSLDAGGRLVIRSFFKFNTSASWGGPRQGAGRGGTRNQDGIKLNQDDSNLNPTRFPSGSVTGADTDTGSDTGALPGAVDGGGGSHQETVELALELFGDRVADAVSKSRADLTLKLEGPDGSPCWDHFAAALRAVDRIRRRPGAKPIDSVVGLALALARESIALGEIPPEPVGAEAIKPRAAPKPDPGVEADARAERTRKAMALLEPKP